MRVPSDGQIITLTFSLELRHVLCFSSSTLVDEKHIICKILTKSYNPDHFFEIRRYFSKIAGNAADTPNLLKTAVVPSWKNFCWELRLAPLIS